jgi:lipopolysaccharide biosynthesis glycosyltransferase
MQWFLALAESSPAFKEYGDMVKVAVHTALRHTSLRPHFLYRGGENELIAWLRRRNVPIIPCRTFLEDEVATLRCEKHEANLRASLRGVLLRIELPRLGQILKLDERVLYTDCDVFFRAEVAAELATIECRYFAVAPEFDPGDYQQMNTGVMWMNLPMLRTVDADFRAFVRQNLSRLESVAWDQGAYREFFARDGNAIGWEKLPPELNWKPYWGDYAKARIIHFHGPKPFQRPYVKSEFPELTHLTGGCYDELCQQWAELLAEAE